MISRWLTLPNQKSMILFGARRAGKTTLIKQTFSNEPYVNFDDFDYFSLAKKDPKKLISLFESHRRIIFDEVQRVPEFLITVKYAIDELKKIIIMTGSSSIGLLSSGSETLAGRIEILECPTLCWGEEKGPPTHHVFSMPNNALQIRDANRQLEGVMRFGGFPEVLSSQSDAEKQDILKNYKNNYFTKDLLLLSNIENADGLLSMMTYLLTSIGSHTEKSHASRESGLSHPTVTKYLNVLRAARLTFDLYGYQHGPAKRFIKATKKYFSDSGIVTALGTPVSVGQTVENFVIAELEKRRRLGVFNCDRLFYYQSAGGAEIDVIIDESEHKSGKKSGTIKAIEIKNTTKPSSRDVQTLHEFVKQDPKKRRGYLFYRGEETFELGGVTVLPIAHLYRAK